MKTENTTATLNNRKIYIQLSLQKKRAEAIVKKDKSTARGKNETILILETFERLKRNRQKKDKRYRIVLYVVYFHGQYIYLVHSSCVALYRARRQ